MQKKKEIKVLGNNNYPIGIFDSGFGGLTVMSAINKVLPSENLIYFGDTAHVPYGAKSRDTIVRFSKDIISFLIKNKAKLIVVACNTVSALALPVLEKILKIPPIIGVIEPGVRVAIDASKSFRIGIIGTEGTIKSKSYPKAINKLVKAKVYQQACPLLVPLVEEGLIDGEITDKVVKKYIKPLLAKKIDTLVLGCTHYPFLRKILEKNLDKNIIVVDSAISTALEVKLILDKKFLFASKNGKKYLKFYVSDNPEKFKKIGMRFFSKDITIIKKVDLVG
ncbi:MAG: glutamate racemase [Endomicrobium sp.]|jgi:glutamate racemase|nr:glutamate racemase [Endomicrobium sp.]